MHKFNVSFTKTQAQLVEIELDGPRLFGIGKDPRTTAWVVGVSGEYEARYFGRYIMPSFVDLDMVGGRSEGDFLAELERMARETIKVGHPKLIVIRAGEQRAYAVLCPAVNLETGEGLEDQYTLSVPSIRL